MGCQHVGKAREGVQRCEYQGDGENIVDHAMQNKCPAGIYGSLSLAKEDPTTAIIEHIRKGKVTRSGWENWPSTREAHRILMREFLPTIPVQQLGTEAIIGHVYHDLNLIAHPDHYRNQTAIRTWGGPGVRLLPFTPTRTAASELDDPRPLPFIKDLFNFASAQVELFVWSNLDICLSHDAYSIIRQRLNERGCYYSGRYLVADAQAGYADAVRKPGIDLFAFTKEWWESKRDNFGDFVACCEAFDWCIGRFIEIEYPDMPHLMPIVYHEEHQVYWHRHRNAPSARHNRKLAREFADRMGIQCEIETEESLGL